MKKLFLSLLAVLICLSAAGCHQNIIIKDTTEITLAEADELTESGVLTDGSRLGELQRIEDENGDSLKGVILTGGQGSDTATLIREGYKTSELRSEFALDEEIGFYARTVPSDLQMNLYVVLNEEGVDYGQLTAAQLEDRCFSKGYPVRWALRPDPENHGLLDSFSIASDRLPAGLYNVFFSAPGLRYMVQIRLHDAQ